MKHLLICNDISICKESLVDEVLAQIRLSNRVTSMWSAPNEPSLGVCKLNSLTSVKSVNL